MTDCLYGGMMAIVFSRRNVLRKTKLQAEVMVRHWAKDLRWLWNGRVHGTQGNIGVECQHPIGSNVGSRLASQTQSPD